MESNSDSLKQMPEESEESIDSIDSVELLEDIATEIENGLPKNPAFCAEVGRIACAGCSFLKICKSEELDNFVSFEEDEAEYSMPEKKLVQEIEDNSEADIKFKTDTEFKIDTIVKADMKNRDVVKTKNDAKAKNDAENEVHTETVQAEIKVDILKQPEPNYVEIKSKNKKKLIVEEKTTKMVEPVVEKIITKKMEQPAIKSKVVEIIPRVVKVKNNIAQEVVNEGKIIEPLVPVSVQGLLKNTEPMELEKSIKSINSRKKIEMIAKNETQRIKHVALIEKFEVIKNEIKPKAKAQARPSARSMINPMIRPKVKYAIEHTKKPEKPTFRELLFDDSVEVITTKGFLRTPKKEAVIRKEAVIKKEPEIVITQKAKNKAVEENTSRSTEDCKKEIVNGFSETEETSNSIDLNIEMAVDECKLPENINYFTEKTDENIVGENVQAEELCAEEIDTETNNKKEYKHLDVKPLAQSDMANLGKNLDVLLRRVLGAISIGMYNDIYAQRFNFAGGSGKN